MLNIKCFKAIFRDRTEEHFLSNSIKNASHYCQEQLKAGDAVWLYQLTNEDGFDNGHQLVFKTTYFEPQ